MRARLTTAYAKKENGGDGTAKARERREKCALGIFHCAKKKGEIGVGSRVPRIEGQGEKFGSFSILGPLIGAW